MALDGIERESALPKETSVDPATLTEDQRAQAGTVLLPAGQLDALRVLDQSASMRRILGDDVVDAVVAVRRYEAENFGALSPQEMADTFRMAWSV